MRGVAIVTVALSIFAAAGAVLNVWPGHGDTLLEAIAFGTLFVLGTDAIAKWLAE